MFAWCRPARRGRPNLGVKDAAVGTLAEYLFHEDHVSVYFLLGHQLDIRLCTTIQILFITRKDWKGS